MKIRKQTHGNKNLVGKNIEQLRKANNLDADYLGDILAHARSIYLLRKFDITSFHSVAI